MCEKGVAFGYELRESEILQYDAALVSGSDVVNFLRKHLQDTEQEVSGMMVTVYDSTYIGLGETMKLDIDGDGEDDLKIRSYYDGPHMESSQTLTLHCLNDETALRSEMLKKESYQQVQVVKVFRHQQKQVHLLQSRFQHKLVCQVLFRVKRQVSGRRLL